MLNPMNSLVPFLKKIAESPGWFSDMEDSSLGYILFKNGYHDGVTFYDKATHGFNPKMMFTARIEHDFTPETDLDREYAEDVKRRMFYNSIGDRVVADWLILNLARALMGESCDLKRVLFCLGQSNSGKSTIATALTKALGGYCKGFDAHSIALNKNKNPDQAQAQRWMLKVKECRILVSSELDVSSQICGAMLKVIVGGSDGIQARYHCQNEQMFIPNFMPICFANDMPKISPYDDAQDNRCRFLNFNNKFVDGEPQNDTELRKDYKILKEMNTNRFKVAFVRILLNAYAQYRVQFDIDGITPDDPLEVILAKKSWVRKTTRRTTSSNSWKSSSLPTTTMTTYYQKTSKLMSTKHGR